jgi:hypothetical protein
MSLLPRCTCQFPGIWEWQCPRHWQAAQWLDEREQKRAADLAALRQLALTRPVHGGYPDGGRPDSYGGPAVPYGVTPTPKGSNDAAR